jgi:hypothetical protein
MLLVTSYVHDFVRYIIIVKVIKHLIISYQEQVFRRT